LHELLRIHLPTAVIALAAAAVQWQLAARLSRAADRAGHHNRARLLRFAATLLIGWTLMMPIIFGTKLQLKMPGNGAQWTMAATLL
jgi:hypothetical protein